MTPSTSRIMRDFYYVTQFLCMHQNRKTPADKKHFLSTIQK
jgi:hypothetical protein